MTLATVGTLAIIFFLVIGSIFTLVAGIALLKFSDPMTRLHAPTKAGTLGIGAFLIASMINSFVQGDGSMHELLITAFLFITAPVSANFIAKVAIHKRTCETPPPPVGDTTWATLSAPPNGNPPEAAPIKA
jgi:multicomponent K+:H+ antiporter subunit G